VTFQVDGIEVSLTGTITLVPADNLASQFLGGYKALASALRKCRQCLAVMSDMKSKVLIINNIQHSVSLSPYLCDTQFRSEDFVERTKATHKNHVALLDSPGLRQHIATTYGLHRDSILNSSKYFHVTEGLIPDIMHDVLEGSMQYEVKELLKCLFRRRLLSLVELNDIAKTFPYAPCDAKNKPSLISTTTMASSDNLLKQTGKRVHYYTPL
jgi:hypothetical protein